ncbi:low affinity iron permease family protein [Pedobacter namyangjuensis]|uniref:low affinity iron permease family protein n=1 Tax=Pedobacter namyangjuensis TaxID=600626 RepID=UPI000DE26700|nr:low affinity iron permease family protein [Pedobacter namyangjuensis]
MKSNRRKKDGFFERTATAITCWTGSSIAFLCAFATVLFWGISGPLFDFSDTWQLVINTGTTIITFLMVFLIQKSQNKDGKAIQLKLNELIAASRFASNRMVDIEDLTEAELDVIHKYYQLLADKAENDEDIHSSHSIDAATKVNQLKKKARSASKLQSQKTSDSSQ